MLIKIILLYNGHNGKSMESRSRVTYRQTGLDSNNLKLSNYSAYGTNF